MKIVCRIIMGIFIKSLALARKKDWAKIFVENPKEIPPKYPM
jgi:hypothetical protein